MSTPQNPYGSDPNSPYGGNDPYAAPHYGAPDQGQPPQYGSPAGGYGSQPGAYGSQPGGYGEQPGAYGSQPGGYGEQAPAYQAAGAGQAGGYNDQFVPAAAGPDPYGYDTGYGYGGGDDPTARNIWGILALIAGILAILGCWIPWLGLLAIVPGILALIFGFIGLNAVGKNKATNKGLNITGIIMGIISILVSIIVTVVFSIMGINWLSGLDPVDTTPTGTSAPVEPETDGPQTQDPEGGGSGGAEGQGPDEGAGAPPSGSGVELTTDVEMTVAVGETQVSDYATGPNSPSGEAAEIRVTIVNNSGSEFDPGFPSVECTFSGGVCEDVFDSANGYSGGLEFEPVPAGESVEVPMAFDVPHSEIDSIELEITVPGSDQGYDAPFIFTR